MKFIKTKKEIKKFDIEKMEVAKLKNMHLIRGGGDISPTDNPQKASSRDCDEQDQ